MTEFDKINTTVALEVLGWRWRTHDNGIDQWNTLFGPPYDKHKGAKFGRNQKARDINEAPDVCERRDHAWLIVNAMRKKGYRLRLQEIKGGDWRASFIEDKTGDIIGIAIRGTDTLAIAIAALDTVRRG